MRSETPSETRSELKSKRRLQLAAAVQTFKIFLKTEKLVLFCQINLDKSTAFSPVWAKSGSGRMTAKMHSFFEKRKWNDKRDTPAAAPPPCRLHFLMFSALHAEKAALLRRKNAFGRITALLAPRMPSQNKKAIPYGMTFCFGGDKRDRTADLMTASHALSQLSYTPIGGVILSDIFGKCKCFFKILKKRKCYQ